MAVHNRKLLQKYNVPGPRYTSYPTVPYWETTPSPQDWIAALRNQLLLGQKQNVGAALYVHLPFCESLCTYCGCNTRITRNHEVEAPYIDSVLNEWNLYLKALESQKLNISELHLGGGTPTFFSASELLRLVDGILARSTVVEKEKEFSLEADPRVTTQEHLEALASRGFNRLSLGIQDFDPRVQEIVHRVQSREQVAQVVDWARNAGYESINFDLIYGLPLQTKGSIQDTIEIVKELRPDRIAFYAYAHVPWIKPGQRRFSEQDLPAGDEKRALYELGREMLESVGYREIGMDHFALETDSLFRSSKEGTLHRNFMGYTSRLVTPLIGLGVSAISDSWTMFSQNEKVVEKYQEKIERGELPLLRGHVLTQEDLVLRQQILNLMTRGETAWSDTEELHAPVLNDLNLKLREFEDDRLLSLDHQSVSVSAEGIAFLRNICMAFDARLQRKAPETSLFSKTV